MTEITIDFSDRVIQRLDKLIETQKAIARAIVVGAATENSVAYGLAEEALECIGGFSEEDDENV